MTDNSQKISPSHLEVMLLVSVTLACLLPFLNKAFNIDEPLFIWVAKQIQLHPWDFYGFKVNWYGTEMDAFRVIKNPPLASYFASLAGSLAGWREITLHAAFLLPALGAASGAYFLAREFSPNPLLAALMTVLNPVFLVSSTSVMCDTTMVALYTWAVLLWVRGVRSGRNGNLLLAALLVAGSALTKYFGITLIPLLLLFTLASGREKIKYALYLLIPVLLLFMYQWGTQAFYGKGLLADAASYASRESGVGVHTIFANLITGLSFTGGCFITIVFFAPKLWSRRTLSVALLLVPCLAVVLRQLKFPHLADVPTWSYYLQFAFFVVAGVNVLALAWEDLRERRDAEAWLLFLWVIGTFLFASVVNWTVNGRSILPMAPVAGVLLVRALKRRDGGRWQPRLKVVALPIACAWLVTMAVTWADYSLAATARDAATSIGRDYRSASRKLWIMGHWGFQYYMQDNGGLSFDVKRSPVARGDLIVVPENNTNAFPEVLEQASRTKMLRFEPAPLLTTMNYSAGAGFYSSGFGPLPFLVRGGLDEMYHVFVFAPGGARKE